MLRWLCVYTVSSCPILVVSVSLWAAYPFPGSLTLLLSPASPSALFTLFGPLPPPCVAFAGSFSSCHHHQEARLLKSAGRSAAFGATITARSSKADWSTENIILYMAQGFSKQKRHSTLADRAIPRHGKQSGPKKGGRVIKPKRQEAIKTASLKKVLATIGQCWAFPCYSLASSPCTHKKLASEHIKHTEQQTAAKVGGGALSLVKSIRKK